VSTGADDGDRIEIHGPFYGPVVIKGAQANYGTVESGTADLRSLTDPGFADARAARSPAGLLRARRAVVDFRHREGLLERFEAWMDGEGFEAWLVCGPGGQGKTRLATHLAERVPDGWIALWLRADATDQQLEPLRRAAVPLLVVVDYAETRAGQLAALWRVCAAQEGATPLRVLLLARSSGDWWTQTRHSSPEAEELLDDVLVTALPPLEPDKAACEQAYRLAVAAFAKQLPSIRGMEGVDWGAAAGRLREPRLDTEQNRVALTLHMTALADLLDAAEDGCPTSRAGDLAGTAAATVEDRMLGHERRYWWKAAQSSGLLAARDGGALSEATLGRAMAAAAGLGAVAHTAADEILARVPGLSDQPLDVRRRVRSWIASLYPSPNTNHAWDGVQPDRLAERLWGRHLQLDGPEVADALAADTDPGQSAALLTVYARAAAHQVFAGALDAGLSALCLRHPKSLMPAAVRAASYVEKPGPLVAALVAYIENVDVSANELAQLSDLLPTTSHVLADTAALIAERIVRELGEASTHGQDPPLPALAASLNNLAVRLGAVGRLGEALEAGQKAVQTYRTLARANPGAHLHDVADSLSNLSARLGAVGRRDEGVQASSEAVEIYRALAQAHGKAHLPKLAGCLGNLSIALMGLGRRKEALETIREAIEIYQDLAQKQPDTYLHDAAMSLTILGNILGSLGRLDEALEASREAAEAYRTLAQAHPDAYLHELAMSLTNYSNILRDCGRQEEGLEAIQEAVETDRALAQARPDAYMPDLATSLNNLSIHLAELEQFDGALNAVREALRIRRALAVAFPDAYLHDVAMSLNNMSNILGLLGQREEALKAAQDALLIRRDLAQADPVTYLPELAGSLHTLSRRLEDLDRREEGLEAIREAVLIGRALAQMDPEIYGEDLR